MDYSETIDFLYAQMPMFHREGASAYKPGLERVKRLSAMFGNPHKDMRFIHVAGTNGKGSTAHTLAAILQAQGLKIGLFTSPHLLDFRERIRVNGLMISKDEVVDFTERFRNGGCGCGPSFFELTTVMALDHFKRHEVDVAVMEVGLGGRLDSTNIITPLLSVITNISMDHTSLLGNTLESIASEKAGIIKEGVPVVVGESSGGVRACFAERSAVLHAPISFADDSLQVRSASRSEGVIRYMTEDYGVVEGELTGECQLANTRTVLEAVRVLGVRCGLPIRAEAVRRGFRHVCNMTGLMGRWMKVSDKPPVYCDTGHNPGGWQYIARQLAEYRGLKRVVIGFVNDKDVRSVLEILGRVGNLCCYFTQPSTPRALPVDSLHESAAAAGLQGTRFGTVAEAYKKALADTADKEHEMIFVGGSTFVVADLLGGDCLDFNQHLLR